MSVIVSELSERDGERTCLGSTERLLNDDVASLRSEGDRDGLGEDVDTGEELLATSVAERELLYKSSEADENARISMPSTRNGLT